MEKLDACYMALGQAAEAGDERLSGLVDSYFAATEEASAVVAGGVEEKRRRLEEALGDERHGSR